MEEVVKPGIAFVLLRTLGSGALLAAPCDDLPERGNTHPRTRALPPSTLHCACATTEL